MQIVSRIVGGANALDPEFSHNIPGRHVRKLFVAAVINAFCIGGIQNRIDAKAPLQFHVTPVVNGVADHVGKSGGKRGKLFPVGAVSGDVSLRNPGCPHDAPLVMVAPQPDSADVPKRLVFGDFPGGNMAVVVQNGQCFRSTVIQSLGGLIIQEEILIHKCFHIRFLTQSRRRWLQSGRLSTHCPAHGRTGRSRVLRRNPLRSRSCGHDPDGNSRQSRFPPAP